MSATLVAALANPRAGYMLLQALGLKDKSAFVVGLCIFLLTVLLAMTLGTWRLNRKRRQLQAFSNEATAGRTGGNR